MKLEKVLSLIPPELLETLAIETNVNYFAKKLQGEVMFKLLLHCIISHKDNSLRTMQSAYESIFFKLINAENNKGKIHYSSISERLSGIELSFFEKLFKHCVTSYKEHLGADGDSIIKFDSTIIALSSKFLNVGYQIKGGDAEKGYKSKHLVRRIVTKRIDTDETIIFITNNKELTAVEVTELYKRRWEIAVFFKFIKQLLNFKHLVSRSENGIQVVLYVTLSAAILLVAFAKENELTNLKIAKQQFANELETEIIKQIIKLCGGDPKKLNEILLYKTS